jgi:FtsZ-interacting cell division protein ZipA
MKKLLFLLLVLGATVTSASAISGIKEGDKTWNEEKKKEKEKEKEKECDKEKNKSANSDISDKTVTTVAKVARPARVEEYVWMLPKDQDGDKMYEEELKKGIVDLYKWYLQNSSRIPAADQKALADEQAFPFKVDARTLQQYFQFIKNNFPGLSEDDLTDRMPKRPVANHKKYAPVSTRDDMESQISIPVNK